MPKENETQFKGILNSMLDNSNNSAMGSVCDEDDEVADGHVVMTPEIDYDQALASALKVFLSTLAYDDLHSKNSLY